MMFVKFLGLVLLAVMATNTKGAEFKPGSIDRTLENLFQVKGSGRDMDGWKERDEKTQAMIEDGWIKRNETIKALIGELEDVGLRLFDREIRAQNSFLLMDGMSVPEFLVRQIVERVARGDVEEYRRLMNIVYDRIERLQGGFENPMNLYPIVFHALTNKVIGDEFFWKFHGALPDDRSFLREWYLRSIGREADLRSKDVFKELHNGDVPVEAILLLSLMCPPSGYGYPELLELDYCFRSDMLEKLQN